MNSISNTFSSNAQSQAASAEEINATVEELTATSENTAERALEQKKDTDRLIQKMDKLSGLIQELTSKVDNAAQVSTHRTHGDADQRAAGEGAERGAQFVQLGRRTVEQHSQLEGPGAERPETRINERLLIAVGVDDGVLIFTRLNRHEAPR